MGFNLVDEKTRIEEDFPKRIKQISDFFRRCKPFTAGIEFAFEQIQDSFDKVFQETSEQARAEKLSFDKKLDLIKAGMVENIQNFASMRIIESNEAICAEAIKQIKPNDVILTYGSNYTIKRVLLKAIQADINFSVIVVSQNLEDTESFQLVELLSSKGLD